MNLRQFQAQSYFYLGGGLILLLLAVKVPLNHNDSSDKV